MSEAAPRPMPFRLVLARPRFARNIGACARVAANFGVADVRVVAPREGWRDYEGARKLAVAGAGAIFDAIREHATLAEALEGCTAAVGFTRRMGDGRRAATPFEGCEPLLDPGGGPVALVFGNEKTGLDSGELLLCTHGARIRAAPGLESMNLSHAAAVVLARMYERHGGDGNASIPGGAGAEGHDPAPHELRETLYARAREAIAAAGLTRAGNPDRMLAQLRRILGARPLSVRDARLLLGYFSKAALGPVRPRSSSRRAVPR